MNPIKTRCNLDEASRSLEVYYWTNSDFHLHTARSALTEALSENNDRDIVQRIVNNALPLTVEKDAEPLTVEKDDYITIIEEAMDSVHDMDVTFKDYANAIYEALKHKLT